MTDSNAPKTVTFVIPCMGRADHVLENLKRLREFGQPMVVVDFSCPQKVGDKVTALFPEVQVILCPDQTVLDISHARNLAIPEIKTPWTFFLDADIVLSRGFSQALSQDLLDPGHFYLCGRHRFDGACGSVLVPTQWVRRLSGYDRYFHGYGGEDIDFFLRLEHFGLIPSFMKHEPESVLEHAMEDRTRNYAEKSRELCLFRNAIYGQVKADLVSALRDPVVPDRIRREARQRVDHIVDQVLKNKVPSFKFSIELPSRTHVFLAPFHQFRPQKTLSYQIKTPQDLFRL